jgi:hypothetical protein
MKDPIQKAVEEICAQLAQDVSYKLCDMIESYPREFRPLVIATVSACIRSQLTTMPSDDRQIYENVLAGMEVVSIPRSMDPRKKRGPTS